MKQTFFIVLIVVILCSAFILYVWNAIHGRNLAEPPEFDLSIYNDPRTVIDFSILDKKVEEPKELKEELPPASEKNKLEAGYLYFKDSFRLQTVAETDSLLNDFLQDFPALKDLAIENLEAQNLVEIELPALDRNELLEQLEELDLVERVAPLEPPVWQVKLTQSMYGANIESLFQKFEGIKIKSEIASDLEYIARLKYAELENVETDLENLKKNFGDVVLVK